LQSIGLEKYINQFAEENINYDTFLALNKENIRDLDLTVGDRIKILKEIEHIKEQEECARGKKDAYIKNILI
jgi:hypothetical protein